MDQTQNGEDDDFGLFSLDSNGVTELARQGDVPPEGLGVFNGPRFSSQDTFGKRLFRIRLFRCRPVDHFIATTGSASHDFLEPESSTDDGSVSSLGNPRSNRRGRVVTIAGLANTSQGEANDQALLNWNGSSLQEIVREGDTALDGNGTFGRMLRTNLNFFNQVLLSS